VTGPAAVGKVIGRVYASTENEARLVADGPDDAAGSCSGGAGSSLSCVLGDERLPKRRSERTSMTAPTSFGGGTFVIDAAFATGR
jgi:hypothetical protein